MQPGDLCCQLSAKPCWTAAYSCVRSCALSQLLCCDQLNSNQCSPSLSHLNIIPLMRLWFLSSDHKTTTFLKTSLADNATYNLAKEKEPQLAQPQDQAWQSL